jgi:hypothetical protein
MARYVGANYLGATLSVASLTVLPIIVTTREGATQAAYFYAAWTIAAGLQLVAVSMSASLVVEGSFDHSRLAGDTRRVLGQTMRLLVPAVVVVAVGATWLLQVLGRAYADAAQSSLQLLAVSALPNVVVMLAVAVARVRHRPLMVVLAQGATCVLGLALAVALMPGLGITGAALGWLLGQVAVAIAVVPWLRRILRDQPGGGMGEASVAPGPPPAKRSERTASANAVLEAGEDSITQSIPSASQSNQTRARMRGKSAESRSPRASRIQDAFEPPCSLEATSATITGFDGASDPRAR